MFSGYLDRDELETGAGEKITKINPPFGTVRNPDREKKTEKW